MVTVYIWDMRLLHADVGHSSIQVGETYISWWPGTAKKRRVDTESSGEDTPFYNPSSLAEDIKLMGDQQPQEFHFEGLNEQKMLEFWDVVKGIRARPQDAFDEFMFALLSFFNAEGAEKVRQRKALGDGTWRYDNPSYSLHFFNCTHIVYLCLDKGGFADLLTKRCGLRYSFLWSVLEGLSDLGIELQRSNGSIAVPKVEPRILLSFLKKAS